MDILNLVFPKNCLECNLPAQAGKPGKYICENCIKKVRLVGWHGRNIFSIWKYEGVVRKAILALKYKFASEIANELANLCARELSSNRYLLKATLVPIPLHWYRQNVRGFNQAALLGEKLARKIGWKYDPDLLIRKKSTIPQAQLKKADRLTNLRGVFVINPRRKPLAVDHQQYVLFDDVYTTGATLREAAKVLRRAGVKNVWGLTIAR